jgi:ribonuclease Y
MNTLALLAAAIVGLVAGFFASKQFGGAGKDISAGLQREIDEKQKEIGALQAKIAEARAQIRTAEAEAKAQAKEIVSDAKLQANELTSRLEKDQARVEEKEKTLDGKVKELEVQRSRIEKQEAELAAMQAELKDAQKTHREALEKVSKLSQDQAKDELKKELEVEFSDEFAKHVKAMKETMEEEAEDKARDLMAQAMQRYASETATESTATVVQLPSDDVKGKIIGKEGRNINAFESATGVDVIIDDTPRRDRDLRLRPRAPLRRQALDGEARARRTHPARPHRRDRRKAEGERGQDDARIRQARRRGAWHHGLPARPPQIIGRLRFRTSYGQNVLKHSVEMAHIGRMLAEEIGANVQVVVEGCLLHDIGKALDHEVAGTHVEIGVEICKRFKIRPEVIHTVAAHHEDIPMETPEAFVVAAADAISGARPGARRESIEEYFPPPPRTRGSGQGVPRRLPRVRHLGRPRSARVRRHLQGGRPGPDASRKGHRPEDREGTHLPGRDQGERDPRKKGGRVG